MKVDALCACVASMHAVCFGHLASLHALPYPTLQGGQGQSDRDRQLLPRPRRAPALALHDVVVSCPAPRLPAADSSRLPSSLLFCGPAVLCCAVLRPFRSGCCFCPCVRLRLLPAWPAVQLLPRLALTFLCLGPGCLVGCRVHKNLNLVLQPELLVPQVGSGRLGSAVATACSIALLLRTRRSSCCSCSTFWLEHREERRGVV